MIRESLILTATVVVLSHVLVGCGELAYYRQAVVGHWQILGEQQSVDSLLLSDDIPPELRDRLQLGVELRNYAVTELALPDNDSYRSYVELDRPYAVWSVFAAPELSLEPQRWCYPVVGCLSYRGYFDDGQARDFAVGLRETGQEVWIGGVPAYSSLGWSDDPLLSTFIGWPDGRLAELVFHELAHQRIYVSGDTAFNEAFATTVGQLGAERWLESRGDDAALTAYRQARERRLSFLALTRRYRAGLQAIYDSDQDDVARRREKVATLAALAADYERWKDRAGGYSGYDQLVDMGPNNAWFAAMATYHELVPAFIRLLDHSGGDFASFYRRVDDLGALPEDERQRRMQAWSGVKPGAGSSMED